MTYVIEDVNGFFLEKIMNFLKRKVAAKYSANKCFNACILQAVTK
ncbi:hypothetical protein RV09_GL001575 [Enterococcus moraviensis]|nr:hypothetical protein RV09_GL001575 [Enterococcus moraviensis]